MSGLSRMPLGHDSQERAPPENSMLTRGLPLVNVVTRRKGQAKVTKIGLQTCQSPAYTISVHNICAEYAVS